MSEKILSSLASFWMKVIAFSFAVGGVISYFFYSGEWTFWSLWWIGGLLLLASFSVKQTTSDTITSLDALQFLGLIATIIFVAESLTSQGQNLELALIFGAVAFAALLSQKLILFLIKRVKVENHDLPQGLSKEKKGGEKCNIQ